MNPHPEITLTGQRVKLRFITTADTEALFHNYADAEVSRYLSRPAMQSIAEATALVERVQNDYKNGTGIRYAIERVEDGALLGTASLYAFHAVSRRCDLGYDLAREAWGKGYMSEALRLLLDYAFEGLNINRVEADIDPRNINSQGILERFGFVREGYLRERWIVNGEISDTALYGLLKADYTPGARQ